MTNPAPWLEIEQIIGRLRYAVDQLMADGGLYDERTAARAFRQAEGDPVAAANLVQALRASLPRFGAALPVERRRSQRPGDGDRGEVRHDRLPVVVAHPGTGEPVTIGHVRVTEARIVVEPDGLVVEPDGLIIEGPRGRVGYGVCVGHNDRKAVALAQLDAALLNDAAPLNDAGRGRDGRPAPDDTDGLSGEALLERLRRPGGCGVGSSPAPGC